MRGFGENADIRVLIVLPGTRVAGTWARDHVAPRGEVKVLCGRIRRLSGVLALTAVALLGTGTTALAATGLAPVTPPPPSTFKTYTSELACNLSAYGYQDGSNLVTMDETLSVPTTAVAGTPTFVSMSNTSAALPASVGSQLTNVVAVGVTAQVSVQGGTTETITVKGSSAGDVLPSQLTALPVISTANTTVTFAKAGTASVDTPPSSLVFTPFGIGTTTFPAITCTPIAASISDQPVVVGAATPAATSGPDYACTNNVSPANPFSGHLPMTVAVSGSRTVGATDTVTLTSPSTGLGAPYPPGATSLSYAGNLTLTGAQSGSIALGETSRDVTSSTFAVSGKLALSKAGTDHILLPGHFTFVVQASARPVVALSCTSAASPAAVAVTFTVTKKTASSSPTTPSASPSAAGTGTSGTSGPSGTTGGTANGQGVPVGAPDTGGGPAPHGSLALIGAACVLLLAGGGTLVVAARRRQKGQAS
jgi:collagen type VII alpha